jgi:superfamily II RNA helicase
MPERSPPEAPDVPATFRGLTLLPFQRRALAAIFSGRNVVVAAPTGAGKTLVAEFAIQQALSQDRRVVYTSPIKALSNQKFRDFRALYGDERVGLMTGDVTLQPASALLIMTTEIFRNTIFEAPERLEGFDFAIFDEVHYLDDRERGTVWEESLIYAPPHVRVVALSATVPNVAEFASWIESVRGLPVEVIEESERPVPLTHKVWIPGRGPRHLGEVRQHLVEMGRFAPRERGGRSHRGRRQRPTRRQQEEILRGAGHALVDHLERRDLLPAIYFCFSRRDCEDLAHGHADRDLLGERDKARMLATFDDLATRYAVTEQESTRALRDLASRGVLFHHAGMLPIDKEIVERLFTTGLPRLLFATETFALGVNMPARSVCFHNLAKFDGISFGPLLAREYWQMAGRAGRQGVDERGWVFALLDETAVGLADLERYHAGRTEPVRSRFNLGYSALLNLFRHVGRDVPEAYQRSYARFQARGARGDPSGASG